MGVVARKESVDLPPTAMAPKLGWMLRAMGRVFFSKVRFEEAGAEIVRKAMRRGTVVYVMRDRSYIDYLFFNWAYVRRGLPLAQFANGLGSVFLHPFRILLRWLLGRREKKENGLNEVVNRGDSALLFLRKPQTLTERDPDFQSNYVLDLIRLQRKRERPILLVPQLLLWSRAPERLRKSFVDLVFGEPDAPGRLRGIWLFLRNHQRAFARVAEPLDLKELVERFPDQSDEVLAKKVRWMLLHYLARERQVVLGPILKSPRRIRYEVLRSRNLRTLISEIAAREKKTEAEVEVRARKLLKEIAADISMRAIRAYGRLLDPIYARLYDGIEVDEPGLERVRDAMRKMPVILVPCHRSHMDYLLLSYLFFKNGLTPPHIAAGKNLSFWPLGWLFRKGGAFFLRRSFGGDRLYVAVFRAYVHKLLREGFPVEFFIEGGRSRTGKMLVPRMGLLGIIVEAFFEGQTRDLAIVPIHIAYQKIIEARSYTQESLGGEKRKEDLKGLLAVPKVLRSRYGRVYVDFAEPIVLSAFCAARGLHAGEPVSDAERRDVVRTLATRISYDITRVARAAPSALAAAVLLGEGRRGVSRERFLEAVHRLRDVLRAKHVRLPKALGGPSADYAMHEALKLFESNGLIEVVNRGDAIVYVVPERGRLQLDYYKNAVIHAFVPEAIAATALLADGSPASPVRLRDRARRLFHLLKYEFAFRPGLEFDSFFADAVRTLEEHGLLHRAEGELRAVPERRADLRLIAGLVENFIEGYAAAARGLAVLRDGPLPERDLLQRILEVAHQAFLTGEIHRFEACAKPIFENALRTFRDDGILDEVPAEDQGDLGGVRLAASHVAPGALAALEEGIRALLPRAQ